MTLLSNLASEYLSFCRNNKRLTKKTITAYETDLRQFREHFSDCAASEISIIALEDYISTLHGKYKPGTVKRKIASIKAFYSYLEYKGCISLNPFSKMHVRFRECATLPKTIPLSSVESILKAAYCEKTGGKTLRRRDNAIRDIAVLELLFATGMRISELCGLKPVSVDIKNQYVRIRGKGNKERIIHIENPSTLSALHAYYENYEAAIQTCNLFFVNRNATPLSDQSVRRIIKHYSKLASINQHITPHMFRHTFATSLLDAGVDIRYIQEFLGHSSITVTQIYTHVSLSKQKEILSSKHPRNNFCI